MTSRAERELRAIMKWADSFPEFCNQQSLRRWLARQPVLSDFEPPSVKRAHDGELRYRETQKRVDPA
jgi:hypothetical protein